MTTVDYYKVLGVEPNASTSQIKRAYYKRARKSHPDRQSENSSPNNNDQFSLCSDAYRVLSDATSRLEYDSKMSGTINRIALAESRKRDAQKAAEMMRHTFDVKRSCELSKRGLVVDDAWFGDKTKICSKTDRDSSRVMNVTRQLQCLVDDSKLVLPSGDPKAVLDGFYDCGEGDNALFARYYFRGKLHEVVVGDHDKLLMPLKEHLLKKKKKTRKRKSADSNVSSRAAHALGCLTVATAVSVFAIDVLMPRQLSHKAAIATRSAVNSVHAAVG